MVQIRNTKAYGPSATNLGDARGRNGWFKVREIAVALYGDGSFEVDVWSKQHGDMPPITFSLPAECRRELIQALKGER